MKPNNWEDFKINIPRATATLGARILFRLLTGAGLLTAATLAGAEIRLTLENSFIEKYTNVATIEADCVVDHSKGKPNAAAQDGDMHSTVRCPGEIRLPHVTERVNAKDHLYAIDLTKKAEGDGSKIAIRSAWRTWNEHRGDQVFEQGTRASPAENKNPDHVFEIPPISQIGDFDLRISSKPIPGYKAKTAEDAFNRNENTRAQIIRWRSVTTIVSPGIGYNHIELQMELNETPYQVSDGSFAVAKIRDWDGHPLLRKKRMVIVKDTPPELAVRGLKLVIAYVSWVSHGSISRSFPGAAERRKPTLAS